MANDDRLLYAPVDTVDQKPSMFKATFLQYKLMTLALAWAVLWINLHAPFNGPLAGPFAQFPFFAYALPGKVFAREEKREAA